MKTKTETAPLILFDELSLDQHLDEFCDVLTDTVEDGAAVGFQRAGEIPDYALDPDGQTLHATTYMHKRL